jgi:hypothetical protein
MLAAVVVLAPVAWLTWTKVREPQGAAESSLRDDQEAVTVKAEVSDACPKESAIRISVSNRSARTLRGVDFHLGIYEVGQPDDLAAADADEHWSVAVAPGATESRCRLWPARLTKPRASYFVRPDKRGAATFFAPGEEAPR